MKYLYAVIETDLGLHVNTDVCHWVFKTITEANAWKVLMQGLNPDLKFIVLQLHPM